MSSFEDNNSSVIIAPIEYENDKFKPSATALLPYNVTVTLKNMTIRLPKSILTERCPYFRMMLESKYQESETNKVDIKFDVDVPIFILLLEYIRTGKIVLSTGNLEPVCLAANYFMLDDLIRFCCDVFKQTIDCQTVDYIHAFAKENLILEVSKAAVVFKEINFQSICKCRVFITWSTEVIEELLCSDLVEVKNEKQVLMFVVEWLEFDLDARVEHAAVLFRKLRYLYVPKQKLDQVAGTSEQLGQILFQIASELAGRFTRPRIYHEGIYSLKCLNFNSEKLLEFERYSPTDRSVKVLRPPAIDTSRIYYLNICGSKDKVCAITKLISGPERYSQDLHVQVYHPFTNTWTVGASINLAWMDDSCECAYEDNIYIFKYSAHDSLSVLVYSLASDRWTQHELPAAYGGIVSATTCGDSIYLLSHFRTMESTRDEIIQFKPATLELTSTPWSGKVLPYKVVAYKSKLVFVPRNGHNAMVVFDTTTKHFQQYRDAHAIDCACSMALFDDSIYIVSATSADYYKMEKLEVLVMDGGTNVPATIPQPDWSSNVFVPIVSIE